MPSVRIFFRVSRSSTIWETTLQPTPATAHRIRTRRPAAHFNTGLNIGSTAASQGAFTGIFQNRWMPSANATWNQGKHTITFGGSFSYTQLNARDERTNTGMIGFAEFRRFPQGLAHHLYSANGFITTDFPARRRQPLLSLQSNRRVPAGQISTPFQSQHYCRLALRLARRSEGKKWSPVQFRSVKLLLQRDDRRRSLPPASSLRATIRSSRPKASATPL